MNCKPRLKTVILWSWVGLIALAPQARPANEFPPNGESIYQLRSTWTRQDGKEVRLETLKGSFVVLAMIYTNCRGACPMIIADMKKIEKAVTEKQRPDVHFSLFSFDPAHDAVGTLKAYALAHGLDLSKWSLYRGSEASVRELSAVLGVKYKRDSDGDFEHSNLITLLDRDGRILVQLSGLKQDSAALTAKIQ